MAENDIIKTEGHEHHPDEHVPTSSRHASKNDSHEHAAEHPDQHDQDHKAKETR